MPGKRARPVRREAARKRPGFIQHEHGTSPGGPPYSQVCSACGANDGLKPLSVRVWQCQMCMTWLDRDVNAAVNVARAAGLAVTACGAQVRPGLALAQRGEAGTLRGAA